MTQIYEVQFTENKIRSLKLNMCTDMLYRFNLTAFLHNSWLYHISVDVIVPND